MLALAAQVGNLTLLNHFFKEILPFLFCAFIYRSGMSERLNFEEKILKELAMIV